MDDIAADVRLAAQVDTSPPRDSLRHAGGPAITAAIRACLLRFPGITQSEITNRLDLSGQTVTRHIKAIRAEWEELEQ